MFGGLVLVLLFSDPMVDVFNSLGITMGISVFYVGFTLAPVASNASELLSTIAYSKRRTTKSIFTAHSTCLGAGCMNNTFCLAIFLLLIVTNPILTWKFTAETLSILFIEICVVITLIAKKHTMLMG